MAYRWTRKPPFGTQIDWGHPLSRGLRLCFALNEQAGNPIDLVTGLRLSQLTATSGSDVAPTWAGDRLATNASNAGANAYTPTSLRINTPFTLVWSGSIIGVPSTFSRLFGCSANDTDASPFYAWEIGLDGSSRFQLALSQSTTAVNVATSISAVNYGPVWIAGTARPGAQAIYVNNPQTAAGSGTNALSGNVNYGTNTHLGFGDKLGVSRNPAATHNYALVYDRVLNVAELTAIRYGGPWPMLVPARSIAVFDAPAVGGFVPGWAAVSNVIIGGAF